GDEVTGDIQPGQRVRYALTLPGGQITSIFAEGTNELDVMLNLYSADGEQLLASNDDVSEDTLNAALEELEVGEDDFDVVVEVATVRDLGEGTFTLRVADVSEADA